MTSRASFPQFLADVFDEEALAHQPASICAVDPSGAIVWVNPAWRRFAIENGAPEVANAPSYYGGISEPLREDFVRAFETSLRTGTPFELDYECSSPEERRTFRLRALPIRSEGLLVEHARVATSIHPDEPHLPLDDRYADANGMILQCANCRRVRCVSSGAFDWVPAWVLTPRPQTSHGICPSCAGYYYGLRR